MVYHSQNLHLGVARNSGLERPYCKKSHPIVVMLQLMRISLNVLLEVILGSEDGFSSVQNNNLIILIASALLSANLYITIIR